MGAALTKPKTARRWPVVQSAAVIVLITTLPLCLYFLWINHLNAERQELRRGVEFLLNNDEVTAEIAAWMLAEMDGDAPTLSEMTTWVHRQTQNRESPVHQLRLEWAERVAARTHDVAEHWAEVPASRTTRDQEVGRTIQEEIPHLAQQLLPIYRAQ